jgi:hypothetical protein
VTDENRRKDVAAAVRRGEESLESAAAKQFVEAVRSILREGGWL